MLWGREAQKKRVLITQPHHAVVACAHPSPLSVRKFFGCRCFSHINRDLADAGMAPINWQIPDVWQDAEKVCQLRSRLIEILNGDPAASPTRRRALDVVLLIRRTVRPRGYASGPSLTAALLDSLFEHLARHTDI